MSNLTPLHGYHCASCNTLLQSPVGEYPKECYIVRMGRTSEFGSIEKTYLYCDVTCAQDCGKQLDTLSNEYINRGAKAPLFYT